MDMIRELYDYKGGKVKLEVCDGVYEGIIKHLYADIGKISLAKVVPLPQRAPVFPLLHFFIREIKSYCIVSAPEKEKKKESSVKKHVADLEVKNNVCRQYNMGVFLHHDKIDSDSEAETESTKELLEDLITEEKYVLKLPEHLAEMLPLDHDIIDDLSDSFYKAITHIEKQEVIGVGFEGENIGRYGELCYLTISTAWCTFLFDILTLKKDAFMKGLKKILESDKILKVIHDSRQPSDALFHQYNTELSNVFDTQVGDVFADMQNSKPGAVGKYVRPLRHCLIQYLSLKPTDFPTQSFKYSHIKGGMSEWHHQPLPNSLRDRALKNVIYLRLLRDKLVERMLRSYYAAVEVYLTVVRGSSAKELELEPSAPHVLPHALLNAGLQTFHMTKFPSMATRTRAELGFSDPVHEDPVQSYLRHVEKYEKSRMLEPKSCGEENEGVKNVAPSSFSRLNCLKEINGSSLAADKVQCAQKIGPPPNLKKCDAESKHIMTINGNNSNGENDSPGSVSEKTFQWPTTANSKKHVSCKFLPAGMLKDQMKKASCR